MSNVQFGKMGNQGSSVGLQDLVKDPRNQNKFVASITSSDPKSAHEIGSSWNAEHSKTTNFAIITKGDSGYARYWQTKNMLIVAMTVAEPPLSLNKYIHHRFKSLDFFSVHVDAMSYANMVDWLGHVSNDLERSEVIKRIFDLYKQQDEDILKFINKPVRIPQVSMNSIQPFYLGRPPQQKPIIPVLESEVEEALANSQFGTITMTMDQQMTMDLPTFVERDFSIVYTEQFTETSSFLPGISEPSGMSGASSSFMPAISEPNISSSSFFGAISEPSSLNTFALSERDSSAVETSAALPISEPGPYESEVSETFRKARKRKMPKLQRHHNFDDETSSIVSISGSIFSESATNFSTIEQSTTTDSHKFSNVEPIPTGLFESETIDTLQLGTTLTNTICEPLTKAQRKRAKAKAMKSETSSTIGFSTGDGVSTLTMESTASTKSKKTKTGDESEPVSRASKSSRRSKKSSTAAPEDVSEPASKTHNEKSVTPSTKASKSRKSKMASSTLELEDSSELVSKTQNEKSVTPSTKASKSRKSKMASSTIELDSRVSKGSKAPRATETQENSEPVSRISSKKSKKLKGKSSAAVSSSLSLSESTIPSNTLEFASESTNTFDESAAQAARVPPPRERTYSYTFSESEAKSAGPEEDVKEKEEDKKFKIPGMDYQKPPKKPKKPKAVLLKRILGKPLNSDEDSSEYTVTCSTTQFSDAYQKRKTVFAMRKNLDELDVQSLPPKMNSPMWSESNEANLPNYNTLFERDIHSESYEEDEEANSITLPENNLGAILDHFQNM